MPHSVPGASAVCRGLLVCPPASGEGSRCESRAGSLPRTCPHRGACFFSFSKSSFLVIEIKHARCGKLGMSRKP